METNVKLNGLRESALQLENIRLKLDQISGITKICATTFERKDAFSFVTEEETANALLSVYSQLEELGADIDSLMLSMNNTERKDIKQEPVELSLTPSLEKFIDSLETARDFKEKHDKSGGLSIKQLTYLSQEDMYEALVNTYNFAFRRGYKTGKQAQKDTKKGDKA